MFREFYDNFLEIVFDVVWTCIIILVFLIILAGCANLVMRFMH